MEEVIHEAQAMCLYHHPNVLPLYTAFVAGKHLWFVEPFVRGGSVYNIMKFSKPDGLDEILIAIIMKEVAKALEYVHRCGGIHRDVKAGNILLDDDGSVLLADFGVAATIERGGSWGNERLNRSTFVGTPCWMAPEVMEQSLGYDNKADIWSFGITLLELAHGRAPFARFPPMKVLLMTIHEPPPQLEPVFGQRQFSKHMRALVTNCLQKDPSKRPTASQILESKFFKGIPEPKYLVSQLLSNLPPLTEMMKALDENKAPALDDHFYKMRSRKEYAHQVSTWNFGTVVQYLESSEQVVSINENETMITRQSTEKLIEELTSAQKLNKMQHLLNKADGECSYNKWNGNSTRIDSLNKCSDLKQRTEGKLPLYETNEMGSRCLFFRSKSPSNKRSINAPVAGNLSSAESPTLSQYQSCSRWDNPGPSSVTQFAGHSKDLFSTSRRRGLLPKRDLQNKEDTSSSKLEMQSCFPSAHVSIKCNSPSPSPSPSSTISEQLRSFVQSQKQLVGNLEQIMESVAEAERAKTRLTGTSSKFGLDLERQTTVSDRIMTLESENEELRERLARLERLVSTSTSNGLLPGKNYFI
eukprot:g626.t1